jgi:hypothetical protein
MAIKLKLCLFYELCLIIQNHKARFFLNESGYEVLEHFILTL